MTEDEMNRRVAEALDYTVMQDDSGGGWKLCHPTQAALYPWRDSEEEAWSDCDEYCNCLNACAEMRKNLTEAEVMIFTEALAALVYYNQASDYYEGWLEATPDELYKLVNATAHQQCVAFLTAKGEAPQ